MSVLDKLKSDQPPTPPPPADEVAVDHEKGTGSINAATLSRMNEDELLAYANLDPRVWQVTKLVIGAWNGFYKTGGKGSEVAEKVDLFTHKAEIKRRFQPCLFDALDGVLANLEPIRSRAVKAAKPKKKQDQLYVVSLFDAHFGKYAWEGETGYNYDLTIANQVYRNALTDLLEDVDSSRVGRILLPIGQDFGHFDNTSHATSRGTQIDFDSRWPKVLQVMMEAALWAVEEAAQVAPLEIRYSGGNHDRLVSYMICMMIQQLYQNDARVDVTLSTDAKTRQYVQWGKTAIGITHGDGAKLKDLPLIMSRECPFWSECTTHEILTGHLHQERVLEQVGVISRILPSLSGTDWYHYQNGWVCNKRTGMGILYDKEDGVSAMHWAHARM